MGTVRWSVPVGGSYDIGEGDLTGGSVLNLPGAASEGIAGFGFSGNTVPDVALGDGLVVFQRDGVITAVDLTTGRVRWRTRLRQPPVPPGEIQTTTGLVTSLVIADGMVAVRTVDDRGYDPALWWLLNGTTGAASPPRSEPLSASEVVPVNGQDAVLVTPAVAEAVDAVSGQMLWRVGARRLAGATVIGATLYGGITNRRGSLIGIQRIYLPTGKTLRELPLSPHAGGPGASLSSSADIDGGGEPPGALLVTSDSTVARIDPHTARILWKQRYAPGKIGGLHTDPATDPPALDYLRAPTQSVLDSLSPTASNGFAQPTPGVGKDIFRIQTIGFSDGRQTSVTLGPRVPYASAGIQFRDPHDSPSIWKLDGPALLAGAFRRGPNGITYVRLEGVDPSTGGPIWRGPWAGDVYVLAATPSTVIAASCAPTGVQGDPNDVTCVSPRLYAINTN